MADKRRSAFCAFKYLSIALTDEKDSSFQYLESNVTKRTPSASVNPFIIDLLNPASLITSAAMSRHSGQDAVNTPITGWAMTINGIVNKSIMRHALMRMFIFASFFSSVQVL